MAVVRTAFSLTNLSSDALNRRRVQSHTAVSETGLVDGVNEYFNITTRNIRTGRASSGPLEGLDMRRVVG